MSSPPQQKSIFSIPPIIKTIFDTFPLVTYPAYPVPARCPKPTSSHPRLFVWITPEEYRRLGRGGGYSFDPECLKWQTYFRFCGVQYKTFSSNNHACPSNSNSLPFLIPPTPPTSSLSSSTSTSLSPSASIQTPQSPAPIATPKLAQWARDHGQRGRKPQEEDDGDEEEEEVDFERGDVQAFMELLDNEIQDALFYTTHIHPINLHNYTTPLYTQSKATFTHPLISTDLHSTALSHLKRRHPGTIDRETIFADADVALEALSGLLGNDTWFFKGKIPGLLDAAVFAYIHIILTGEWVEDWAGGLKKGVKKRRNLVKFWERTNSWWKQ